MNASRSTGSSLRRIAARGAIVNSGFAIFLAALNTFKRLVVVAFLTREEFGLWGILLSTLITLAWLKDLGIADKYVQQREGDQAAAFHKAFTMELGASLGYFILSCAVLPLYAAAYGHSEIIVPGIVLAFSIVISAFETPVWIPYREMRYARQRTLEAIDPIAGVLLTIALCAAGMGYWGIVIGTVTGSLAGAIVCVVTSPYRLRLRLDRDTAREYLHFSWPLVGNGLSKLIVVQGSLLVANRTVGLAGVGVIGLATAISGFANRVDTIVSQTIYPAVCRVVDEPRRLAEVFVKSNRIALMWAMPFGVGLALFSGDLVHFVFGDRWTSASGMLAVVGLTCAFAQVAFNWALFFRALNDTRPIFVLSVLDMAVFLAVAVPAMFAFGLAGYAAGMIATTAVQITARGWYLRRLFPAFSTLRQMARAVAPTIPAAIAVVLVRETVGLPRTLPVAVAELTLYAALIVIGTFAFERRLVTEVVGYLRPAAPAAPAPIARSA
jgi:polysaccharide transporter, PST family